MNKRYYLIGLLLVSAGFVFQSCPNPAQLENKAPIVSSLTASNNTLSMGESSTITCTATDPDGDTLTYTWSALNGTFSGTGNTVVWTSPNAVGNFNITVTVSDGRNGSTSNYLTIVVNDTARPVSAFLASPSNGAITLRWTNPASSGAFAGVMIRRGETGYPESHNTGTLVYNGLDQTCNDMGLTNGTTYYYSAFTYNHSNEYSMPATTSGIPSTDTTPPPVPTNLQAFAGNNQIALSWTNPVASDLRGIKIRYRADTYPINAADGTLVTDIISGATSYTHTGLSNGSNYYYALFAYDTTGNHSEGVTIVAQPGADTTPPANVTNFTASAGNGRVSLSWTNPADSDFQRTRIVRKAGSEPESPEDGITIYSGTAGFFDDTALVNGTVYHYMAYTYDNAGNYRGLGMSATATPSAANTNSYSLSLVDTYNSPDSKPTSALYDGSYLWFTGTNNGQDYKVDMESGEVLASFNNIVGKTSSVLIDAETGYRKTYPQFSSSITTLYAFNITTRTVTSTGLRGDGQFYTGLCHDGQFLWVLEGGYLKKINTELNGYIVTFTPPQGTTGNAGLAWDSRNPTWLFIGNNTSGLVTIVKRTDGTKVGEITLPYLPDAAGRSIANMFFANNLLWVCDTNTGKLYRYTVNGL